MIRKIFLTISLAFILLQSVIAQWNNNPEENMVLWEGSDITNVASVKTSDNNIFVSYFYKENNNYNLYAQLLDSDGYKLWDENGLLISSFAQDNSPQLQHMICDNDDNLVIIMADKRQNLNSSLFCYKLSQEGDFLWGNDGFCIYENNMNYDFASISAFCDSENEIIASAGILGITLNSIFLQRIMNDQSLPWGLQGKFITGAESQKVFSTGEHIVCVFKKITGSWNNPDIKIMYQLFDNDGTQVFNEDQIVTNAGGITRWDKYDALMTDDNQTVITWHDDRHHQSRSKAYAQCIDIIGNCQWAENGICLSQEANTIHFYPMVVGKGSDNDVVFIWQKMPVSNQFNKGINGQKVTEDGTLEWGNNGKQLVAESFRFHKINGCIIDDSNFFVAFGLHPTEGYFDTVYTHLGSYSTEFGNSNWLGSVKFASSNKSKGSFNLPMIYNDQVVVTWLEGFSEPIKQVKGQNIWFNGTLGLITGQLTPEENHFSIYPNPSKDYCQLKYDGAEIESVLIINVQGIVVYKEIVNKLSPRINVSRLKKGFYYVQVHTADNGIYISKLVKE